MISIKSLLIGGESEEFESASNGARKRAGAYTPESAHGELLARVRGEAEADSLRHAEDMLGREFPIGAEAEGIAEARLAALRVAFVAADTDLNERRQVCEAGIDAGQAQIAGTERALLAAGIPEAELGLAPLHNRSLAGWWVGLGAGLAAVAGFIIARLGFDPLALGCAIAGAVALSILLLVVSEEPIEERRVASLRRSRNEEAEVLEELTAELSRNQAAARGLREETRAVAEGEIAFAKRLVAAYTSAAFGALPAGSLAGGRKMADQAEPTVALPAWVSELEVVR